jgi:hypothetical protein
VLWERVEVNEISLPVDCKKCLLLNDRATIQPFTHIKKLPGFPLDPHHDVLTLLPDSEPIESTFRSAETKVMLDGGLWGTHTRTGITIISSGNLARAFLMIAILLNELDDTWSRGATARVQQSGSLRDGPCPYIRFLFECEDTPLERLFDLKVYLGNWSLKIEASRGWILIEWEHDSIMMRSMEAAQHRSVQKSRVCTVLRG